MLTIIYVFRRKPGITRDEFLSLYEAHRKVMLESARGLVSYTQALTTAPVMVGGIESNTGPSAYDAISTYVYQSVEDADYTSSLPAVSQDSQRFIDFDSMLTLTLIPAKVR